MSLPAPGTSGCRERAITTARTLACRTRPNAEAGRPVRKALIHTVLIVIPLILQALTARIHILLTLQVIPVRILTAVMTLRLLALNMAEHGTVLTASMVHPVLTARSVRKRLTAVIARLLTAVMIIRPLVLKPAEVGTGRPARCRVKAAQIQALELRIPPRLDGFFRE